MAAGIARGERPDDLDHLTRLDLSVAGVERVLSDNGACYRSNAWRSALADTAVVHKRTRPYRPQTNGKIERFHGLLLEEWA